MIKCISPNYIWFSDPDEDHKKKVMSTQVKRVHMCKAGDRNFSQEFYDKIIKLGAIEVPCGQCYACRLEYSRVWANRCYLESKCHDHTWFVTLSYRDEDLVYGEKGFPTLEKDAISNFIRKLRDHFGHDIRIRFFGCGEYGDNTMRPHYHLIIFGAPIDDLTIDMPDMSKPMLPSGKYPIFRRKNSQGDYVFWSKTIYDCWQKGKIEIEDSSWNCAAYVSRYVMKKQKGTGAEVYKRLGILPEFLRMSNRPGIGADWLNYNKDKLLRNDYLSVKNLNGVQTSRPPRYFDKLMLKYEYSIDAQRMEVNKLRRIKNARERCVESISNKSVGQRARDEGDVIIKKSKVLQRDIT